MTVTLVILSANGSNLPKYFNFNGDLIQDWYRLGDNNIQDYTQWIFENISSGDNDLILDFTVLVVDLQNNGRDFPADFLLIYEVSGGEWMFLLLKE